jgi:hypothetical protein
LGVYAFAEYGNANGIHAIAGAPSTVLANDGWGTSVEGVGIWADSGNADATYGAFLATANDNYAIEGFNNSIAATAGFFNGGSGGTVQDSAPVVRASGRTGDCLLNGAGESICTGGHSTAVRVQGGARQVALYGVQAAENWFEDFGSAQLAQGGTVVQIDPAFAATISGQADYHVFLTPQGDCKGLYVTHKTPTSFEVHELQGGQTSVAFDYRITARRAGHENERLRDVTGEMQRDARVVRAAEAMKAKNQADR